MQGEDLIAAAPDDDMTVDARMEKLIASGVIVNACKPCLDFRGITPDVLRPGIRVTDGMDFMEKKDLCKSVLTFL